jgi:hypothetical protein
VPAFATISWIVRRPDCIAKVPKVSGRATTIKKNQLMSEESADDATIHTIIAIDDIL